MDIEKIKKNFDVNEPLLLEWAVDVFSCFRKADSELANQFEDAVCTDAFISKVFETDSSFKKTKLLKMLSFEKFKMQIPFMAELFLKGDMEIPVKVGFLKRLAVVNTGKATELIAKEFDRSDARHIVWCESVLKLLPGGDASSFVNRLLNDILPICDKDYFQEDTDSYLTLVKMGIQNNHPESVSAAVDYLVHGPYEEWDYLIFSLLDICGMGEFEFTLFLLMMEGEVDSFPTVVNRCYKTLPGEETLCDAFRIILRNENTDAKDLVNTHLSLLPDTSVKKLIESFLANETFKNFIKAEGVYEEAFYGAVISLIWSHYLSGDMSDILLEEDDVVFISGLDCETNPYIDVLINHFKKLEILHVVPLLSEMLAEESNDYAALNVIKMMQALNTESFIPDLFRFMSNFFETGLDNAMDHCIEVLANYGLPTINYMDENFDLFDKNLYIFIIELADKIMQPESEQFLLKYFDQLIINEKIDLLDMLTRRLSENAVERLKHKTGKSQFNIDKLFVITSLLNGNTDDSRFPEILDYVRRQHEIQQKALSEAFTGDFLNEIRTHLILELECESCGDISDYKVHKVFMSGDTSPYVVDELICMECGRLTEFQITDRGRRSITAEAIRTRFLAEEVLVDEDFQKHSVVEFIQTAFLGRAMSIKDGLDEYRKRIDKNPGDPGNYIGIGNVYKFCGKVAFAKQYYEEAIQQRAFYIEPYFQIAQILAMEDEPDKALDYLEQGKKYLQRPVVCKGINVTSEEIVEGYIDLYNRLIDETGSDLDYLSYSFVEEMPGKKYKKIGRNEKCPCGSGKKYKKCCMIKQKRAGLQ